MLAGEFTAPSIRQLTSLNFSVIYIPYQVIVTSFRAIGVELEFDQATADSEFERASAEIKTLTPRNISKLRAKICADCDEGITSFMNKLHAVLRRHIVSVSLIPAWGDKHVVDTLAEAKNI